MLRSRKDLFDALQPAAAAEPEDARVHALQLATAVLLVEVMRADADFDAAERAKVIEVLHAKFSLGPDELARLVELAERSAREAHDYHSFTSRINDGFDAGQKLRMIEYMWDVAYADGRLTAHENHVLWRISDLLHVPHGAYIAAKMRAREAAERGAP